ncbi:MAG: leucine-zipper of insertion element, partial [Acidobacteriaceae bacterium]|nr:leucine-zipper of insertion element [Acidobacteriaceae bacterium]
MFVCIWCGGSVQVRLPERESRRQDDQLSVRRFLQLRPNVQLQALVDRQKNSAAYWVQTLLHLLDLGPMRGITSGGGRHRPSEYPPDTTPANSVIVKRRPPSTTERSQYMWRLTRNVSGTVRAGVRVSSNLSLSELFGVVFQSYLASCRCMQEMSGVSEAARDHAMTRFRLIQPYLEERRSLQLVAADANLSFRTAQRWVSQYRKLGLAAFVR